MMAQRRLTVKEKANIVFERLKVKSVLHNLRNILFVIRRYKNWSEIVILKCFIRKELTTAILRNGIKIDAPKNNTLCEMVDEIFFKRVYTPNDLPIGSDDIVVDIGANIGIFTILAASRTRNVIYAFEPFPENVEFLNHNIYTNGFHNIITHTVAVSDKVGVERLFLTNIPLE
ncbi:unnamed protein product [marine sediment metagenome]|uniref:Uncharacterized protein n=1 Tax=marine sediment metagenome TaxID=412755 RepID=X1RQM6_9ZZZZ